METISNGSKWGIGTNTLHRIVCNNKFKQKKKLKEDNKKINYFNEQQNKNNEKFNGYIH